MKKRIFVDAHVLDSEYQGTRTFIKGIYTLLSKKEDLEIYLAAADIVNLENAFPDRGNLVFVPYKFKSSSVRLAFEIPYLLKKFKIDVAHFQYVAPPVKVCRYLVTTHDVVFNEFRDDFPWYYRLSKNFLFGFSARASDILTTVSEYSRGSIRLHLKTGDKPIYVVPNGVNKKFFEPFDRERSRLYIRDKFGIGKFILYVSRFEPRKNHALLLRSYLELKLYDQGIHLVMLGHRSLSVPAFDRLYSSQSALIRKSIFIHSNVDDDDLLEFYRAANLFVYPSRAEGFGIPPLEAGALKVPVLCSNSSAMSDFAFFGKNHFDPNDEKKFTQLLQENFREEGDTAELERISAFIATNYSWQRAADKVYQLVIADHAK